MRLMSIPQSTTNNRLNLLVCRHFFFLLVFAKKRKEKNPFSFNPRRARGGGDSMECVENPPSCIDTPPPPPSPPPSSSKFLFYLFFGSVFLYVVVAFPSLLSLRELSWEMLLPVTTCWLAPLFFVFFVFFSQSPHLLWCISEPPTPDGSPTLPPFSLGRVFFFRPMDVLHLLSGTPRSTCYLFFSFRLISSRGVAFWRI